MVDYHLIMDLIPTVARIFFLKQLGDVSLSAAQCVSFHNGYVLGRIFAVNKGNVILADWTCFFVGVTAGYRVTAQNSGPARKGN